MDNKPKESKGIFDDDKPPISSLPKKPLTKEEKLRESISLAKIGIITGLIAIFIICLLAKMYYEVGDYRLAIAVVNFFALFLVPIATGLTIASFINSKKSYELNQNKISKFSRIISFLIVFFLVLGITYKSIINSLIPRYTIRSYADRKMVLVFPKIGGLDVSCIKKDNHVRCSNCTADVIIGESYIDAASEYGKNKEKIECMENAICYHYMSGNNGYFAMFVKGAKDDEHFELLYSFDEENKEEIIKKIVDKTHFR